MSAVRKRLVPSLELLERRDTPSAGALDPTFGVGGLVRTPFPGGGVAHAAAVQADGKIVVAGDNNGAFALARYNPNGTLDRTFNHGGLETTLFGGGYDSANAVALQADGKIVVAGTAGGAFALARYNPDGTLDKSFDGDGTLTTSILAVSYATSVALQADGKIVAAGSALQGGFGPGAGQSDIAVARYNADGTLDKSFDRDGFVTTYWGTNDLTGSGVAIQADGKIVVAGTMDNDQAQTSFVVLRYNGNGSLDVSFHGGSVSTRVGPGAYAAGLALQPDGKIVVAGDTRNLFAPSQLVVARYNGNGTLDTGFGVRGVATTGFGVGANTEAGAVAVQADGKIVVAGQAAQGGQTDFAVVRFTTAGALDASLAGGKTSASFGSPADGNALALQPDGKAVVVGDANGGFALARFDLGAGAVKNAQPASKVNTLTVLQATPVVAKKNQPVTVTATVLVTWPTGDVPTGKVILKECTQVVGTAGLNAARKVSWSLTGLGVGIHTFTAYYQGDDHFAPSTSITFTVTVRGGPGP